MVKISILLTLSPFLIGMVTCYSVEMGSCRMVCDRSSVDSSSVPVSVGAPGKKGPQGPKGDKGSMGARGPRGEPAEECLCPEHNALQKQIDDMKNRLRRIHAPVDCREAIPRRPSHRGGVFTIYPDSFKEKGINLYCDSTTDGGGWMVFQRRMDGSVDFFRGWNDYEKGFGDLNGEFWLGLNNIYKLMKDGNYELRVDLADFEGNTAYAKYSTFKLGGPESFYNATITGYSGTAGNSLGVTNIGFSTKDQDHDTHASSCANAYKGATWYTACHSANLNGPYLRGEHESYADSVIWRSWKGYNYSLKFSEMKIRKVD